MSENVNEPIAETPAVPEETPIAVNVETDAVPSEPKAEAAAAAADAAE